MKKTIAALASAILMSPVFNEQSQARGTLTAAADAQHVHMICRRGEESVEFDKQYTSSGWRGRFFGFNVDENMLYGFWGNLLNIPEGQEFPSHEHVPVTINIAGQDVTSYVRFIRIREDFRDQWDDYYTIEVPLDALRPMFLQMYEYGITPNGWLCERQPYVPP